MGWRVVEMRAAGLFCVVARTMVMEDSAVDAADDEIKRSIRTMVSSRSPAIFFTIRQNCNTMESSKVAKFEFQRSDVAPRSLLST